MSEGEKLKKERSKTSHMAEKKAPWKGVSGTKVWTELPDEVITSLRFSVSQELSLLQTLDSTCKSIRSLARAEHGPWEMAKVMTSLAYDRKPIAPSALTLQSCNPKPNPNTNPRPIW